MFSLSPVFRQAVSSDGMCGGMDVIATKEDSRVAGGRKARKAKINKHKRKKKRRQNRHKNK